MNEQLVQAKAFVATLSDEHQEMIAHFMLEKIEEMMKEEGIDDAEALARLKHAQKEAEATRPAAEFFKKIGK